MGSVGAARSGGGALNNRLSVDGRAGEILRLSIASDYSPTLFFIKWTKEMGGDDRFYPSSYIDSDIPELDEPGRTLAELEADAFRISGTITTFTRAELEEIEAERRASRTTGSELETTSGESRRLARAAAGTRRASKRGRPSGSR